MFELATPASPFRPVTRVLRLTDIDQVSSLFASWEGQFDQLSRGRFESTLRIACGRILRITAIDANQRVLLRGHDSSRLFTVHPVIPGNAADLWQGRRLRPGQMVLLGPDGSADHCSAKQTRDQGIFVRPEVMEEAARLLLGLETVTLPRTWEVVSPSPEAFAHVNTQITRLMSLALVDPNIPGTREFYQIEQDCIRALVRAIFPTTATRVEVSLPARSELVRQAIDIMHARLVDPVGAVDLCQALGASERTLRLAFRERFGIGPMAYYKSLRLNAVRAMLKISPQRTVAEIARTHGFHHLGNFAADFRRLFGESPSTTQKARTK